MRYRDRLVPWSVFSLNNTGEWAIASQQRNREDAIAYGNILLRQGVRRVKLINSETLEEKLLNSDLDAA